MPLPPQAGRRNSPGPQQNPGTAQAARRTGLAPRASEICPSPEITAPASPSCSRRRDTACQPESGPGTTPEGRGGPFRRWMIHCWRSYARRQRPSASRLNNGLSAIYPPLASLRWTSMSVMTSLAYHPGQLWLCGCPLPAAPRAGRRIRSGNSDRAGAADRGSRRRGCAMVCGLVECSARRHIIGRFADPVKSNCHAAIHNTVSGPCALWDNAFRPTTRCFHKSCAEAFLVG